MHVIFTVLDYSAIACYLSIAALLVYHLLNCWQQTVPTPVPAIATAEPTIDLPTALPAPSIAAAPTPIVPSTAREPEPQSEPTPIADIATASTVKRRRQASSAKGFSKRQPVTA